MVCHWEGIYSLLTSSAVHLELISYRPDWLGYHDVYVYENVRYCTNRVLHSSTIVQIVQNSAPVQGESVSLSSRIWEAPCYLASIQNSLCRSEHIVRVWIRAPKQYCELLLFHPVCESNMDNVPRFHVISSRQRMCLNGYQLKVKL